MDELIVNDVSFGYKDDNVIENFSYTFNNNKIYSIVGHNGAGKTTLIRLFLGILKQKKGEIIINGSPKISYVPDLGGLFGLLTVKENIEIFSKLNGTSKIDSNEYISKSIKQWGLYEKRNSKVNSLSMGQKQRLSLIVAGVNDPDIILLDEPSNSIDIVSQDMLNEFLTEYRDKGKMIILATHDINLIEKVCDEVIILDNGVIKFSGARNSIINFTDLYKKYTFGGYQNDN
jgi:ABC-2 type transport system ATP-binding protein